MFLREVFDEILLKHRHCDERANYSTSNENETETLPYRVTWQEIGFCSERTFS